MSVPLPLPLPLALPHEFVEELIEKLGAEVRACYGRTSGLVRVIVTREGGGGPLEVVDFDPRAGDAGETTSAALVAAQSSPGATFE